MSSHHDERDDKKEDSTKGPNCSGPLHALALLAEPVRRAVYEWVAAAEGPVTRDDVARAVGIGRPLAAFHLDRLAAAGLLEITYERRTGRSGPGAGRPAKLYSPAPREFTISVPPRRYDLLAELLAAAIQASETTVPPAQLVDAARGFGQTIGREARRPPRAEHSSQDRLVELLTAHGYSPVRASDGTITLRNCPFEKLARRYRTLVCATNAAIAEGVLQGLSETGFVARLAPGTGRCCVIFQARREDHDRGADR